MEMDLVMQFVNPEMMIVVVACYVFGMFLKSSKIDDWLIPFILLLYAIMLSTIYSAFVLDNGFTIKVIINGSIQGLFAAALSVYGDQLLKQAIKKR